jgi:hypothetical protein
LFAHILEKLPKAWQELFHGKEGKPTAVLEALCDYHMFFGRFYGYAVVLINI